jgi:hypothetical protein
MTGEFREHGFVFSLVKLLEIKQQFTQKPCIFLERNVPGTPYHSCLWYENKKLIRFAYCQTYGMPLFAFPCIAMPGQTTLKKCGDYY